MIEYKRFISYIYSYNNGEKENNCGYAKIEAKNGICKFTINIKSCNSLGKSLDIYIFYRDSSNKYIVAIPAHSIELNNDICDCSLKTDIDNLFNSNQKLDNICGIFAVSSTQKLFATEWDHNVFQISSIIKHEEYYNTGKTVLLFGNSKSQIPNKQKVNSINSLSSSKVTILEDDSSPIIEEPQDISDDIVETHIIDESNNSDLKLDVANNAVNSIDSVTIGPVKIESDKDKPSLSNIIHNKKSNRTSLNQKQKTTSSSKYVAPPKLKTSLADRIFDQFPGMYPFEDDEIIDCVKLDPQDIGIFPMDKWVLANNSFLLHGYYTYRHLIFARLRYENDIKYILGVPGVYRDRERFMANMFGFCEFKSIKNSPKSTGDFGYWYMDIRL